MLNNGLNTSPSGQAGVSVIISASFSKCENPLVKDADLLLNDSTFYDFIFSDRPLIASNAKEIFSKTSASESWTD